MPTNRFQLLAAWYLRFNGYFTIANFTVHPDYKKKPGGTDADIIAVRFPHSEEYQLRFNFKRDSHLVRKRVDFLICEVKAGQCDINQKTWRDSKRENIEYALRWMGFESDETRIKRIAGEMYARGAWEEPDGPVGARFVCFGSQSNPRLREELPGIQEIFHPQVIGYLRERFCMTCNLKTRVHWDKDIVEFAEMCGCQSDEELIAWAKQGN